METSTEGIPKLEDKWGPYECPYPIVEYKKLHKALENGIKGSVFIYAEKALANLICAGWRDAQLEDVVVLTSGTRSAIIFSAHMMEILQIMKMDDEVIVKNEHRIQLKDKRQCLFLSTTKKNFRGVLINTIFFCLVDEKNCRKVMEEFWGGGSGINVYLLDMQFDEDYKKRQAIKQMERFWNATLKLISL